MKKKKGKAGKKKVKPQKENCYGQVRDQKGMGTQRQGNEVAWLRKSKEKEKELAKIQGGEEKGK